MNIVPEALSALEASYLPFGYDQAINAFNQAITPKNAVYRNVPFRRLNNLLLACLPMLTHGYEGNYNNRRLLAVGTPEVPLVTPGVNHLHTLVTIWAREWAKTHREKFPDACARLMDAVALGDTARVWQSVSPQELVLNTHTEGGMVYQAIPSLLATLLQGKEISINDNKQKTTLRKVIGEGSNRGIYVVSQPFYAYYIQEDEETGYTAERVGYFAYRIDFEVETYAGRIYNSTGQLRPWIFVRLSCQRYAHAPLSKGNYGRNVSILTGVKQPRYGNLPVNSTLVRLQADLQSGNQGYFWRDQLRDLLASANARPLLLTEEVLTKPAEYGVLGETKDKYGDEYFLVHAEGYKYERRGHSVKTGFHFDEQRDVLDQVLKLLNGLLIPDQPLPADRPAPSGAAMPMAMRPFEFMHRKAVTERGKEEQPIKKPSGKSKVPAKDQFAIWLKENVLELEPAEEVQLLLVWREKSTLELMKQQVQKILLLKDGGEPPSWLKVTEVPILDKKLMELFFKDKDDQQYKDDRNEYFRKQYDQKRKEWEALLNANLSEKAKFVFAFIETGKRSVDEPRNIKGAIREACARLGINSQMLVTVPYKKDSDSLHRRADQSKGLNAGLDLLIRQTGALYGPPGHVYAKAGLPKTIADETDVIAIYRRQTNNWGRSIHYALAVRLRFSGAVDVMLPQKDQWIPYAEAGPCIGLFFGERRYGQFVDGSNDFGLELKPFQMAQFAARIVTMKSDRPTLVVIEAEGWRNASTREKTIWPQLKNDRLASQRDVLDFQHVHKHNCIYHRDDPALEHLLGVVRLRMNGETPQYLPAVLAGLSAQDFEPLSGFLDRGIPNLWHYYSIGRLSKTQKSNNKHPEKGLYKLEIRGDEYGANTAFRHQQIVEMVPFFARPDLQTQEGLLALCRIPHYLRSSPSWSTGNTLRPFPMHLAKCLVEDYLDILNG